MIRTRSTRLTQPVGAAAVADRWALRSPVLLASAAHGFANVISGALPALGSTARFLPSVVGVGANGSASSATSAIGFEDYAFGGTTPITVIAFSDERPGANRSFLAQGTEVILRVTAAGTGVEFILNSFATNDRTSVVADARSSPGFFAGGTYGPSGKLRAYANTAVAEITPTGTYANSAELFTAIYTQGLNQLFDKRLALLAVFRSEFSQAEMRELSANPWQLFKPTERRILVPVAASAGPIYSSSTSASAFTVRAFASSSRSAAWSVRAHVGADGASAWSVRNHVSASAPAAFSVLAAGLVSATASAAFSVRNHTTASRSAAASVRNFTSASASAAFSVLASGLVTASRSAAWTVRNAVAASAGAAFTVRNHASALQAGAWSVRSAVAATRSAAWSVKAYVYHAAGAAWSVDGEPIAPPELGAELSVAESLMYLSVVPGVSRLSVAQSATYLSVADAMRRISVKAAP